MNQEKPIIIAGPCVIEDKTTMFHVAMKLNELRERYDIELYYKSSFCKANRTKGDSYRGPGIEKGLSLLTEIKQQYDLPIITDIHESYEAEIVAEIAEIIQIPALLCRQSHLIEAAAHTGRCVNIKKGPFLSGNDMYHVAAKARKAGIKQLLLTERGNSFGYNNLIVDFRNITIMQNICDGVVMDCTHSVQLPNACNGVSGGHPKYIESMALAAKAFGAKGYFFEVHPEPQRALCDGKCMLQIDRLENIIKKLI